MSDDIADIRTEASADETGAAPAPVRKKARKKRVKSSAKAAKAAKAATSATEERIGHRFADAGLLVTAMTHV